ncbi:MAG: zinc-binding protein [Agathobaculum desmolans]|uniref:LIM zinc-binding protein n=1 Tax=Agathobaculum desmolans TaxID=39484 RepID=UPI0005528A7E|nr:LIM zinc-binding protein [Agathobaculum desmolans]
MQTTYICNHCGEVFPLEEAVLAEGDRLCQPCAERLTFICDECGGRFYIESDAGDGHHSLCRYCYDHHYTRCDRCGVLIHNSDVCEFGEEYLCRDCYDDVRDDAVIHDYNYTPDLVFHGKGLRKFGVELEIDNGGQCTSHAERLLRVANRQAENLYIKTDGSLDDGLELVTHPMTLDYHLHEMPWGAVLDTARQMDYQSHSAGTCGLHVHISRMAFGCTYEAQEAGIARLVFFVEKFWPELLRFSRRTQYQLNRWAARYGMKLCPKEQIDHAKNSCAGRYTAVNLTNADTVELRLFRGTLKLNTLTATLQLVDHLCEVAVSMSDTDVQDMSWFDFLDRIREPELIQYLKERRLYVNEAVCMACGGED